MHFLWFLAFGKQLSGFNISHAGIELDATLPNVVDLYSPKETSPWGGVYTVGEEVKKYHKNTNQGDCSLLPGDLYRPKASLLVVSSFRFSGIISFGACLTVCFFVNFTHFLLACSHTPHDGGISRADLAPNENIPRSSTSESV